MSRRRVGAAVLSTALVATGIGVLTAGTALAAATGGVGATLPYVEVQAENAAHNGTVIGPSAAYNTLAAESSYRKAVTLAAGQYVEFTTPSATNSIVFRYSIPDSSNGSVRTTPINFSINGAASAAFTLTNAYSWFYGGYPFTNSPGGNPHHFYDEVHRLFPTTYPAGTKFRLSATSATTIDFADFENVAGALSQPAGSVSVTSRGADPTGAADATGAFNSAIQAAGAGGTVWIPEGTFKIPGHIAVNNVTIKGAGMWRSTVTGAAPGFYGNYAPNPSANVHLADFAIFGDVQNRDDNAQVNGIGGAMSNSTVDRLWIEHDKVGAWMDGPMDNLVLSGLRIRNVTADGVNFHKGVTNSRVTNSDIRNTGDDGLATWAEGVADANDSFDHNTVQYPILANAIAIYGGHDNVVADNRIVDAGLAQGGGIHVAQRFTSTTLGRTDVLRNTIIRSGSLDPNWQFGVGALWFDARDGAMNGLINVDNILIQQSPYEAIQFVSGSSITNVQINNATIQNTGTYVVQKQVSGSARITNSTATGTQGPAPIYDCGAGFTLTDGGGNSGIFGASACTMPTPTFPPYVTGGGTPTTPPTTTPTTPPTTSPTTPPTTPPSTDLAAGKPTAESSHNDVYPSSKVTDADQNSYWESANNAFPQWVQVDLGAAQPATRVVLTLPSGWGARNQTLSVQGSTNGTTFSTVKASAAYAFNPAAGNTVTITFPATTQRYWRLNITANTGWPAGQISGFQVWNS
ncbi:MAG: discoidin domain-containing protein [Actinoplanes sp.]